MAVWTLACIGLDVVFGWLAMGSHVGSKLVTIVGDVSTFRASKVGGSLGSKGSVGALDGPALVDPHLVRKGKFSAAFLTFGTRLASFARFRDPVGR